MKTLMLLPAFFLIACTGGATDTTTSSSPPASEEAATPAPAPASNGLGGLGTWTGTGTTYAPNGQPFGDFTVELVRTAIDDHTVDAQGTVTLDDGQVMTFGERFTSDGGNTFRLDSEKGHGGGVCLGEGLCQSYEDLGDGAAIATTMIADGPDRLRVLVTQLQDGRAERIARQTLTRKQ